MAGWSKNVLQASMLSLLLCLIASLGSLPAYSLPLALLGIFVAELAASNALLTSILFDLLPITIILDIIWCAVYGPYMGSGASLMGLIMVVLNLFLKLPFAYASFELMNEAGGNPFLVLSPDVSDGGGSSSHERISEQPYNQM